MVAASLYAENIIICDWLNMSNPDGISSETLQALTETYGYDVDFDNLVIASGGDQSPLLPVCTALADKLVSVVELLLPVLQARKDYNDAEGDAAVEQEALDSAASALDSAASGVDCTNLQTLLRGVVGDSGEAEEDGVSTLLVQLVGLVQTWGEGKDCGNSGSPCYVRLGNMDTLADALNALADTSLCTDDNSVSVQPESILTDLENNLTDCVHKVALPFTFEE